MKVIAPNRQIIEEASSQDGKKSTRSQTQKKRIAKIKSAGSRLRDAGGVSFLENMLLGNQNQSTNGGGNVDQAPIVSKEEELAKAEAERKAKSKKTIKNVVIGVAVAGLLGFIIYKVVKSAKGGKAKKPTAVSLKK